ncbi:LytR/AlgR family response regulator transcription factor [Muribaculum intestinale]|uniref:Response regulator transcription factor n=1 Tax=Muribaculum intestinale TaxID=1796646 RepID=A0A4S2FTR8_9BACT|nr:LytTR family DNA-binding domain-containing protein [Muribaculum intestinale]MYM12990.1 response regulator [Muribaculum intestinale]TGY72626.1 response regulator transcription factor [Muribaculum intestinale]
MIKCVAIDDEPIALSIIQEYCRRYGDIDLKCFTSPVDGMEYIKTTFPDIVFLDIEMNSHNGITMAKELPENTCLIFTTAYSQYALDGFNVDAIDFLHKPVFYPRFERAMQKAMLLVNAKESHTKKRDTITLKVEYKTVVVDVDDISYVEAMDNYVKVSRPFQPTLISQITMKEMESLFPTDRFIRVHRSFIVSLDSIDKFSNRRIFLKNYDKYIPVGRTYNDSFNNLYTIFKQNDK